MKPSLPSPPTLQVEPDLISLPIASGVEDVRIASLGVRVFNPHASNSPSSLDKCFKKHELQKRRTYGPRLRDVEHASFTPLILSASHGGLARELSNHLLQKSRQMGSVLRMVCGSDAKLPTAFYDLPAFYDLASDSAFIFTTFRWLEQNSAYYKEVQLINPSGEAPRYG